MNQLVQCLKINRPFCLNTPLVSVFHLWFFLAPCIFRGCTREVLIYAPSSSFELFNAKNVDRAVINNFFDRNFEIPTKGNATGTAEEGEAIFLETKFRLKGSDLEFSQKNINDLASFLDERHY